MKHWLVNLPKKYWTTAHILWAVVVFGLHAMSSKSFPKISFWEKIGPDKIVHALMFFFGTAFAVFSGWKKYKSLLVWGCAGVLLEYYQFFCTTDRFFDWYDVYFDTLGVFLAVVFVFVKWKSAVFK